MSGPCAYLSFNPNVTDGYVTADRDDPPAVDLSVDPPLRYSWVLWEQITNNDSAKGGNYSDATHKVASLNTVKGFWKYWNHLPQPSELLHNKKFVREAEDGSGAQNVVDAIMIFRDAIKPEWEDKVNMHGGHFQFQLKGTIPAGQVDEYWNNLVLGMVGSTIEPAHMITGIRLVDKLNAPRPSIRIEVWFSNYDQTEECETLQNNIEKCMCTKLDGTVVGAVWGKTEKKAHKTESKR